MNRLKALAPALIAASTQFVLVLTGPLKAAIAANPLLAAVASVLAVVIAAIAPSPLATKALPCPSCGAKQLPEKEKASQ